MSDISPTGSTVTIPGSNFTVPGLDVFNDFVTKVNASIAGLSTNLGTAASADSVKSLNETVTKTNEKVASDLNTAIKDLSSRFYSTQTSSQPTKSEGSGGGSNAWLFIVGAFIVAWFIAEKRNPS